MSIRRSLILSLENAEHQAEDTAILTEVEDLKIENEMQEAEKQVVEVSAENERISDAIDEGLDDVQQLTEVREQVEEVGGEAGISAESYQFVQAQVSRIYAKYGVNKALPSMESFNGYSGDRRYANRQLVTSMEEAEKGIFRRIWDTLVRWARAAYNAVKGFFGKIAGAFKSVWTKKEVELKEVAKEAAEVEVEVSQATKRRFFTKPDGKAGNAAYVYDTMKNTVDVFGKISNSRISVDFIIEQYGVKTESAFGPKDFESETWFGNISLEKMDDKTRKLVGIDEKFKHVVTTKPLIGGSLLFLKTVDPAAKKPAVFCDTYTASLENEDEEVKTNIKVDALRDFGNGLADVMPKFEKFQEEAKKVLDKLPSYTKALEEAFGQGTSQRPDGMTSNEVTSMVKTYINATNKAIKLYSTSCMACKSFADELVAAHNEKLGAKAKEKQDKINAKKNN